MKRSVSYKLLPALPVLAGAIALLLRFTLYTMENQSGLLPGRHPLHIASVLLAACTAVLLAFFTALLKGPNGYEQNFPFSRPRAQGSFLAGLLMLPVVSGIWSGAAGTLDLIWAVLGFAASGCLIASGYFQLKGAKPHFLLYFVICLFFVLHMICKYREWSGNPQVEDYVFSLLGCVCLALFAYHKAAFSAGMGRRRMLLFSGMLAVFFCIGALIGDADARFYAAGGIWTVSNLCTIDPPKAPEA